MLRHLGKSVAFKAPSTISFEPINYDPKINFKSKNALSLTMLNKKQD